jgi:colanic acid/amylovoran biosynthesis glycosyltransferase
VRVALVLYEFPSVSETFLVDKFLGLLDRGLDVHVVAERANPAAWPVFPQLRARPDAMRRIHAWPRGGALPELGFAGRQLAQAAMTHPLRLGRTMTLEIGRRPLAAAGSIAFAAPFVALEPDIVHFEFGSIAAHRMHIKRALGCRVVVSFRGFDVNYYGLDVAGLYDAVWAGADALHFLGADLERRARSRGCPDTLTRVTIPPAVSTDLFRPEPREESGSVGGAGERPLRVLSVGRLHWKKGYEFALGALRRLRDAGVEAEYRIVGGGPFEPAIRGCVEALRLSEEVRLMGAVPRDAVRQQLQWGDVLLHPAVSEGFCNVVMEAQAMELPVVCSDADGLAENVGHEETGLVVPRRDDAALAEALLRLARDGELRRRMGRAGRVRVSQRFRPARQIDAFVSLYTALLGR